MIPADLCVEDLPAVDVFDWTQVVDTRAWPRDKVGQTKTPFRQTVILFVIDTLRHQARIVQQLPKTIRKAGKMVAGNRGPHARINAHEQDTQTWLDPVFKAQR